MSNIGLNRPDDRARQFLSFKKKDPAAIGYFYQLHHRPLYEMIRLWIRNDMVAEEIVDDVFVKLSQKTETINDPEHIWAFLYNVAKKDCVTHFRNQKVQKARQIDLSYWLSGNYESSEEVEMIKNELLANIYQYVEKLPKARKKIFKMYLEGMENGEIAEKLGIRRQSVVNHLGKALKYLKTVIPKNEFLLFLILFSIQDS